MKQFQITSRPRHLRYLFFIDDKYSYANLFKLMCSNQRKWGGRFNPIIPVNNNVIPEGYLKLLKYYDPDYIFYSGGVDPEIIKSLRIFNPCSYVNMSETPMKVDFSGVNALYLLGLNELNSKLVLRNGLDGAETALNNYYQLNFGLETSSYLQDNNIAKSFKKSITETSGMVELNRTIHWEKPLYFSELSKQNVNTVILRNLTDTFYNDFEIVVCKDESNTTDLLYFWNRMLFEGKGIQYVTVSELELLSSDKFFGGILYDISLENTIKVASTTLEKDELQNLIETKLKPIAPLRRFEYKNIESFPSNVLDSNGLYERDLGEKFSTQGLVSSKGLIQIPKLSFTNKLEFDQQVWAIDIDIKEVDEYYSNSIKFPYTTETRYIIRDANGRINRKRNISILVGNQSKEDVLEINIPEFKTLLRQLVMRPVIDGELTDTKYREMGPHDASNRLNGFLKSFEYDFSTIDDFFTDRFWVELFEYLITNDKASGDSIEFEGIKERVFEAFKRKKIKLGKREKTYKNEENLELGLKKTLEELCKYRVFLKGFNLKCKHCSSTFWYHLNDVGEKVSCKGCLEDFILPVESKFSYRLSDLVKNNIYQSKSQRDGNLAVIRTLVSVHRRSLRSFGYSPQVNLYDDLFIKKPCAEIDVACLSEGLFIIGEAKHSSAAFSIDSNKSLKSLAEIAIAIRPDKIILSCYEDPGGKLEKAKKSLIHIFNRWAYQPEIETLKLHTPDDSHLDGHRYFLH